jgi:hypothetical protein
MMGTTKQSEYNNLISIPDDLFQSLYHILDMMKEAQQGFHKVSKEIKPADSTIKQPIN